MLPLLLWALAPFATAQTLESRAFEGRTLELSHDYVVAASDRLAMGGAGLAFARGVSGAAIAPGGLSRRHGADEPLVVGLAGRLAALGWTGSDLPNLGGQRFQGHVVGVGAGARVERVGFAALATGTRLAPVDSEARVEDGELRAVVALGSEDRILHLGLGGVALAGRISRGQEEGRWFTAAPLLGVAVDLPSSGLAFALAAQGPAVDGNVEGSWGVQRAVMPAQGAVGVAWASVAEPTPLRRHPTRLAADVLVTAPVEGGLSPEAQLLGIERARGERWTFEPRLGAEVELWPERLRLRAGTYREPARNADAQPRWHGTGGLELHVLDVRLFGRRWPLALRNAVDLAPRYAQLQILGASLWSGAPLPAPPG